MKINRVIKTCFRSLLIHRLRSFLSTLGILFGVMSIVAMLSIGEGAKRESLEQIAQLGAQHIILRSSLPPQEKRHEETSSLSLEDAHLLRIHIPFLKSVSPLKVIRPSLTHHLREAVFETLAVTKDFFEIRGLQLTEGRFLCDLDQKNRRLVCLLGYEVAKKLGGRGHVGHSLRLNQEEYEIVGILQPTYWKESKYRGIATRNLNQSVFIPLESTAPLEERDQQGTVSEIALQVQDVKKMQPVVLLTKKILQSHRKDYQMIIPEELIRQAQRTQQIFNWILGGIATISLLVGGIGIMNMMLSNVSQRIREIGIRRSVGASKRDILFQFLLEALVLTLIGALLGIFFGIGTSFALSLVAGWKTVVTFLSIALSLLMASVIGVCSGIYPAYQAASKHPIDALRHIG